MVWQRTSKINVDVSFAAFVFSDLFCLDERVAGGEWSARPEESGCPAQGPREGHAPGAGAEWADLSVNHLEGRTAAFFCYADAGANEMDDDGRPKKLRHKEWFPMDEEPFEDNRNACAPLVWQCRYSGVEVPDALWTYAESGAGVPYADNQAEDMVRERDVMAAFDAWTDAFAAHVGARGKVPPGRWRAFGYEPPRKGWEDLKLKWRDTGAAKRHGTPDSMRRYNAAE